MCSARKIILITSMTRWIHGCNFCIDNSAKSRMDLREKLNQDKYDSIVIVISTAHAHCFFLVSARNSSKLRVYSNKKKITRWSVSPCDYRILEYSLPSFSLNVFCVHVPNMVPCIRFSSSTLFWMFIIYIYICKKNIYVHASVIKMKYDAIWPW